MSSGATPRPTSVTAFGWMVVLGSAFLVFSAFEQVSSLSSLESRRQVEEFLAEPPADGLGLGVETTLDLLHVLSVVTGGCAAAAAVLGFFALRRHRKARLGLTVVVVPMFVAGLVLGGILSALVAAGTAALWLQPARDWFNGVDKPRSPGGTPFGPRDRGERGDTGRSGDRTGDRTGDGSGDRSGGGDQAPHEDEQAPQRRGSTEDRDAASAPWDAPEATQPATPMGDRTTGDRPGPRAYVGFGEPGAAPADAQPGRQPGQEPGQQPGQQPAMHPAMHTGGQPGWQHGGPAWRAPRPPRPAAVLVACVVAWVACAVVGAIMLATVAALAASPDLLMDEVRRQNPDLGAEISQSTLVTATIGIGVAAVLWCIAASVVAFFVIRGQSWARITLAVSATVAALGSVVLAVGSVAMLLPAAAAATTAYCLLFRPEVRAWFSHP